jgi:glutamate carboxypeptidase
MEPREVLRYFDSRQAEIIGLIGEIVNIESPSQDAGRSRAVTVWVEHQAIAMGAEIEIGRVESPDGVHLIIRAFADDAKQVLLLGHTDTVHPVGANAKNPTRTEGDRFYGCGIFDMKSGVVLMLEALRYFQANNLRPPRPITILLSCDEEIGSHTGRPLVEREAANAEYCLIPEPSAEGRVKTGRKGTGMFKLRAHGVPAHAGLEPEKGANAIAELARQVEQVHALARPEIGTTVNVTTFSGGTTTNVIPDLAECDIDVRFGTIAEAERIDASLRALPAFDKRVSLALLGGINRPPMERTEAVVKLFEKARSIAASFDYELNEAQVGGASDGNCVAALGVPVLDGLGITGAGAHRLDEHIVVSDVAKRATLITLLLNLKSEI